MDRQHWLRIKVFGIGTLFSAIVFWFILTLVWFYLPKPELLSSATPMVAGQSRAFYDTDGQLMRLTLADDQRYRILLHSNQIPESLKHWVLYYEDRAFYEHSGVNWKSVFRAFWQTYILKSRRIGASTITMQVARLQKNISSHEIFGKIQQIFWAYCYERYYTKEEILTAYLNLAPYGGNIEGVEAASLIYFHKSVISLSLPEQLALVVIPQNPIKRYPLSSSGYKALSEARQRLFDAGIEENDNQLVSIQQKKSVISSMKLPLRFYSRRDLPFIAPHLTTHLSLNYPFSKGRLDTTIDRRIQAMVREQLHKYLNRMEKKGIENASVLILNHETSEILSWVGSSEFFNTSIHGQVDGILSKRSPGSALKPFVYALGLEQGIIHPRSLVSDLPKRYAAYTPENFDQAYLGPISAADALRLSRNVPAVWLQSQLSKPSFHDFLKNSGVSDLKPPGHYGLALSLGAAEVSVLELAQLYASLASQGIYKEFTALKESKELKSEKRILSPEAALLTLDMLSTNQHPTDDEIIYPNSQKTMKIAWKTGTSFAFRDAWAAAVAGPYTVVVWIGNFNGIGNPNFIGRKAAGPLLFRILRQLYNQTPWDEWNLIERLNSDSNLQIKSVSICEPTGDLPGRFCPKTVDSWFIPGISPIRSSKVYRALPIDIETGERLCWHQVGRSRLDVFEFWPSNVQRQFRLAGLSRKLPPPLTKKCHFNDQIRGGQAPKIESPQSSLIYTIRSHRLGEESIRFESIVDADVRTVYWFVDDRYVGSSTPNEPFFWNSEPGEFVVRAVDDKGLFSQQRLYVEIVQ